MAKTKAVSTPNSTVAGGATVDSVAMVPLDGRKVDAKQDRQPGGKGGGRGGKVARDAKAAVEALEKRMGDGMAVEMWEIERVKPYGTNPRRNEEAVKAVAASIREFGFRNPIVVDREGVIICGHTRRLAAMSLGLTRVPVHVATDLTDTQARAYRIADNATAALAEWDDAMLELEIKALKDEEFDLALLGFDASELARRQGIVEGQCDPDEVPEPPATPITKRGDLWILGEHRLLCGDSTLAEDVVRLMNGERARLMNTDPPYGISYDNAALGPTRRNYELIDNDAQEGAQSQQFLEAVFRACVSSALAEDAAWYLWHAMLSQGFFAAAAAAAAKVVLHRQIIWVKDRLILGRGQYHWKHELCFMGWVDEHQPPDYGRGNGERDQTTVWEIKSVGNADRRDYEHPTPKPVELFTTPMVKHLLPGEIAYEPFSGSGPQFIAAEQLGRRCFGMEIEPRYCDVIVTRWEKFTGRKAKQESAA